MEPTGLSSLPGLIRDCFSLGNEISTKVQDYAKSKTIAAEIAQSLKTRWNTMGQILDLLNKATPQLGSSFQLDILQEVDVLRRYLQKAIEKGSRYGLFTPGQSKSVRIALGGKDALTDLLNECDKWEDVIHKRLQIIIASQLFESLPQHSRDVISRLRKQTDPHVDVDHPPIAVEDTEALRCSWVRRVRSPPFLGKLVEFRYQEETSPLASIIDTVRMLKGATDRRMSILKCAGYYHEQLLPRLSQFVLVYSSPAGLESPRSLRDVLTGPENMRHIQSFQEIQQRLTKDNRHPPSIDKILKYIAGERRIAHPLNHRLQLANQLATAVLYVHSAGFVHKNINPENILLFTQPQSRSFPNALGYPFLVGFDRARSEQARSAHKGAVEIADCLYHHPERWGKVVWDKFSMAHDIYSIGIVLLEVGLWESFVFWIPPDMERYVTWAFLRDMVDQEKQELKPGVNPAAVQQGFIDIAKKLLPQVMGDGYTNVVVACLSGIFSEDIASGAAAEMGMLYIENVISKLEKLQLS
jgi:hypothetical protein